MVIDMMLFLVLKNDIRIKIIKNLVYKIPYRHVRAWPRLSARASKGILHANKNLMPTFTHIRANY